MLHKWLLFGELYDPFSEFFVHLDPHLAHLQFIQPTGMLQNGLSNVEEGFSGVDDFANEYQGGLRLWESKYVFRKEMLPAFVGEDFGRKVKCMSQPKYSTLAKANLVGNRYFLQGKA